MAQIMKRGRVGLNFQQLKKNNSKEKFMALKYKV